MAEESLPDELRRRANEAYAATGINLSVLHQVAYRLETQEKRIAQLEYLCRAAGYNEMQIRAGTPCVELMGS